MDELTKALKIIEEFCGKSRCSDCHLEEFCDDEFVNHPIDWEITEVER